MKAKFSKDAAGLICSGICVLHCITVPLLLATGGFGVLGAVFDSDWFHRLILVPVLALIVTAFPLGLKRHRRWWPLVLALMGFSLLVAGLLMHAWEVPLTMTGAVVVGAAHWWNRRLPNPRLASVVEACGIKV